MYLESSQHMVLYFWRCSPADHFKRPKWKKTTLRDWKYFCPFPSKEIGEITFWWHYKHPVLGFTIARAWPLTCFVPIWAALSRIGVYLTCKASKKGWMHFGTKLWMHFRCSKAKSLTVKVWPGDGCWHSWPQSYLNVRGIVFRKPAATLYKTCNTFEYFLLVVYYTQNSHIFLKQADLFDHFPSTHLFFCDCLSLCGREVHFRRGAIKTLWPLWERLKLARDWAFFTHFPLLGG